MKDDYQFSLPPPPMHHAPLGRISVSITIFAFFLPSLNKGKGLLVIPGLHASCLSVSRLLPLPQIPWSSLLGGFDWVEPCMYCVVWSAECSIAHWVSFRPPVGLPPVYGFVSSTTLSIASNTTGVAINPSHALCTFQAYAFSVVLKQRIRNKWFAPPLWISFFFLADSASVVFKSSSATRTTTARASWTCPTTPRCRKRRTSIQTSSRSR